MPRFGVFRPEGLGFRELCSAQRHEDVRQWMVELRIDEVLSILLSHHDRDLVPFA